MLAWSFRESAVEPEDRCVLLNSHFGASKRQKELVTEILHEKFNVCAMYVKPQNFCCLFLTCM
jgi:hypothetical protein